MDIIINPRIQQTMDGEKTPVSSFRRNFSIPCQNIFCLFAVAKAQQIQGAQEDVPAQNKTLNVHRIVHALTIARTQLRKNVALTMVKKFL